MRDVLTKPSDKAGKGGVAPSRGGVTASSGPSPCLRPTLSVKHRMTKTCECQSPQASFRPQLGPPCPLCQQQHCSSRLRLRKGRGHSLLLTPLISAMKCVLVLVLFACHVCMQAIHTMSTADSWYRNTLIYPTFIILSTRPTV